MTPAEYPGPDHLAFWESRLKAPSYVYVIQAGDGPVKIGVAKNVRTRMAGLQTGNPFPLRLLFVFPGDTELEWNLHCLLRVEQLSGEWFDGPKTRKTMDTFRRMGQAMVDAYENSGEPPEFIDFIPQWAARPSRTASSHHKAVRTYLVDPEPAKPLPKGDPRERPGDKTEWRRLTTEPAFTPHRPS